MSTDQDRVRRLLAQLGSQEDLDPPPAPAHVVARVETTLHELRPAAPMVSLRDRPTRRSGPLAARLAAAAAVAVLLGTGGLAALGVVGGSSETDSSAAPGTAGSGSSETSGTTGAPSAAPPSPAGPDAGDDGSDAPESDELGALTDVAPESGDPGSSARRGAVPPDLTTGGLVGEAEELLESGVLVEDPGPDLRREQEQAVEQLGCAVPSRPGALLPVTLDGDPAVLVLESAGTAPPATRPVVVLACRDTAELADGEITVAGGGR